MSCDLPITVDIGVLLYWSCESENTLDDVRLKYLKYYWLIKQSIQGYVIRLSNQI